MLFLKLYKKTPTYYTETQLLANPHPADRKSLSSQPAPHLPPHTCVPDRSNQHSSHMDGQPASSHNLPVLYIYPLIAPNKPVHTDLLSVTVPVVPVR